MKKIIPFLFIFLGFLLTGKAHAQGTQVHLKEVHLVTTVSEGGVESLIIRGLTHTGKKINIRLNNLSQLTNGNQTRSDCVKYATLASVTDHLAFELYLNSGATINPTGNLDARNYAQAPVELAAGMGVGCVVANKNKYNYTNTNISWFDLP